MRVRLQLAFGSLRHLALAAQLLHAGSDGREIVGSGGLVHVCSSHLGYTFLAGRSIAGSRADHTYMVNIAT
jgi:hypothetical protein